jgi:triosephosphate isomerase
MRTPIIAGNWKMYKTVADAVKYVKEFRVMVKDIADVEIVLAPPFTAVHAAAEAARNSNVIIAAQDCYWEREGAFTGQVSAQMVREAGAEYVIIGHSERRTLFGETDTGVNQKTVAAFAAGLTPIVCIGETLDQRDRSETMDVLDRLVFPTRGLRLNLKSETAGLGSSITFTRHVFSSVSFVPLSSAALSSMSDHRTTSVESAPWRRIRRSD